MQLIKSDITKLQVDAIVNAANETLLGGGGVDGAIHKAAGFGLFKECLSLKGCKTGEAKITKGYKLPAKYVIHTVGPRYKGKREEASLLASCYRNSLNLAKENNLHSIAFPSISTGIYGYPLDKASDIAINTISEWENENKGYEMNILICVFDSETEKAYQQHF